jgi:hypothetical protein
MGLARRTEIEAGGGMAREACAVLCRLMARLDAIEIPETHARLVDLVSRAMNAIYGARSPDCSAARRASGAALASQLLSDCLALLQAQPAPPASVQAVLMQAARAASAIYALRQQAEAEFGHAGLLGPGSSAPAGMQSKASLGWSRGVASVHAYGCPPIIPPAIDAGHHHDQPSDDEEFDGDAPADEDDHFDDGAVMSLDALRALSEVILADDGLDEAGAEEKAAPPAPPLAPAAPPPRQMVEGMGDRLRIALLDELASDFEVRQATVSEDASWSELEQLDRTQLARADALAWQGASVVEPLARAVATATEAGPAFAAALPLLCIDSIDATDAVMRAAEHGRPAAVDGLVEAFRQAHSPEVAARLPFLLEENATPGARQIALRVMAERGAVSDAQLDQLLLDPDPAMVSAAVSSILRVGKTYALARLEYMADHPAEEPAATEILVAAAVIGSFRARERLRARVRAGDVNDRLIHALAACGDERDVAPLAELALAGGPLASPAIVALGWLGSAHAIPPLCELVDDDGFAEEAMAALTWLLGPAATPPGATLGPGRWWAGVPWSVKSPASLLAADDTGALWRELAFLELVARTGQHIAFDPTWPVPRQRAAAASWKASAERLATNLPSHTWLYRGQPESPERSR